jgi:hypothetical protein
MAVPMTAAFRQSGGSRGGLGRSDLGIATLQLSGTDEGSDPNPPFARPGDRDPSFGQNGVAVRPTGFAKEVVSLLGGRILVAGLCPTRSSSPRRTAEPPSLRPGGPARGGVFGVAGL